MRLVRIVACVLLWMSSAAFAASASTPNPAPPSGAALAAILGTPSGAAACSGPRSAARGEAGILLKTAFCSIQCPSGTVSCTSNTSCSFSGRDCSRLEPGHVTCNGVTTNCSPPCCSTGTARDKACCRCLATGGCTDCCRCDGGTTVQCSLQCG